MSWRNSPLTIIHTADWHLGQSFYDYPRREEHLHFLAWLRETLREKEADVLLVAGDIFDSSNPSAESQRIFYHFLKELHQDLPGLQVVIIAGNHDSAARLEAPNPLLETMRVSIRGTVKKDAEGEILPDSLIVPVLKGGETVAYVLAVPYLRQGDYPQAENHGEGVGKLYHGLFNRVKGEGLPVIAMGHLQATGSEISSNDRSERAIIGGLETIPPDAFSQEIRYTALGHLHRAQRVSTRENIRYAGAPLPMSFAEKNNKQGVTWVQIQGDQTKMERILYDTPVKLLSIPRQPAPLDEVLQAIAELPDGEGDSQSPFLEIKVTISQPEPSLRYRIEEALQNKAARLARIELVAPRKEEDPDPPTFEELRNLSPLDIALDHYQKRYAGESMPEEMQQLLSQVIREVEL